MTLKDDLSNNISKFKINSRSKLDSSSVMTDIRFCIVALAVSATGRRGGRRVCRLVVEAGRHHEVIHLT